jgi:hypothetical protein
MNLELTDTVVRRLRFAYVAFLSFAIASTLAIPFEILDAIGEGFDAFVLIPLGIQLAFALVVGVGAVSLRRVCIGPSQRDLCRTLLALRIYFAAHAIFVIVVLALMSVVLGGSLLML